jgi:hypothetical protein
VKQVALLVLVFACGFGVCWLVRDSKGPSGSGVGEPAAYRQVEVTVPSGNPERAGFSDTYSGTLTAVSTEGEESQILAHGETSKPAMKVTLIARDGRRVSLLGQVEPK